MSLDLPKYYEIDNQRIAVNYVFERKARSRVSFTQKGISMRISTYLNEKEKLEQIETFKQWAINYLQKNKKILHSRKDRNYVDGEVIYVLEKKFTLKIIITHTDENTGTTDVNNGLIIIKINAKYDSQQRQRLVRHIVIELMKKYVKPFISHRIIEINNTYFKQKIKKISIRNKISSWGSCSHDGSINMSLGLTKAPLDIIDYVIVHELAHLIEFSHSEAFWSIVRSVIPDYSFKEKWLKENQFYCKF